MLIYKNALGKIFILATFIFLLISCVDENNPPGCEKFDKPVIIQGAIEVEEGQSVFIDLPTAPDDDTRVKVVAPTEVDIEDNGSTATIYNATQEMSGIYRVYYIRNHCYSEPAEINVNVVPPSITCTVPENTIKIVTFGSTLTYTSVYGGYDPNIEKYTISGGNSQSDFEIIFGSSTKPTNARSYAISGETPSFMRSDEVIVRLLYGGSWFYASSNQESRVVTSFENGKMIIRFCDMKFSGSTNFIANAKLTEN